MNGENLQSALYAKLIGNAPVMAIAKGVFVDIQQPLDAGLDSPFPFITIGQDTYTSFDSMSFNGTDATCQIDLWSRQNNLIQIKTLGSAVVDALQYSSLTITDAQHVLTQQISSTYSSDPDGHTKRGILLFQVLFKRN